MASNRTTLLIASLTTLVVACAAPRPPYGVVTEEASAWARSPELAARLVQDLDRLALPVRRLLGESRDLVPEVWLQCELAAYRWWAAPRYYEGLVPASGARIHLRALPSGEPPGDTALAHELTHLLLPSRVRDGMPWAVEEAACDVVSHAIVPGREAAAERWWLLLLGWSGVSGSPPQLVLEIDLPGDPTPTRLGRLALDGIRGAASCRSAASAFAAKEAPNNEFCDRVERGLAFFVLQRVAGNIGVEETLQRLRALTQQDTVDWRFPLATMAGLPPALGSWPDLILDDLRSSDAAAAFADGFRWHLLDHEPLVPPHVAHSLAEAFPGTTPYAVHTLGHLRLTLAGTPISIPATDILWLADEIDRAWPDPPGP